jgi:hypothetical protein
MSSCYQRITEVVPQNVLEDVSVRYFEQCKEGSASTLPDELFTREHVLECREQYELLSCSCE